MNDRDRLAAALQGLSDEYDNLVIANKQPSLFRPEWTADRLIDLGWTRLDEEDGHRHPDLWCEPCVQHGVAVVSEPPLDEERLARAILTHRNEMFAERRIVRVTDHVCQSNCGPAIAKAYREDTDESK